MVRRRWAALRWHLVVLALALAPLLGSAQVSVPWGVDEGLYAAQAHALDHGSWDRRDASTAVDPTGSATPFTNATVTARGVFPYVKHPLWPLLLAGTAPIGAIGLVLLGGLAVVVAAGLAGALARRVARAASAPAAFVDRAGVAALWVAAGGPLTVNGAIPWAHAWSAAAAALAAWGAAAVIEGGPLRERSRPSTPGERAGRRGRAPLTGPAVAVLGLGLALGVLLRSEAVLFAAATLAVVGATVLRRRGLPAALWATVPPAAFTAVVAFGELRWVRAITGSSWNTFVRRTEPGTTAGQLAAAAGRLLVGVDGVAPGRVGAVTASFLGAVAGGWLLRRRPAAALAAIVGSIVAFVVAVVLASDQSLPGLLVAWPVAVLGLVTIRPLVRRGGLVIPLAAVAMVTFVLVAVGGYRGAGGGEWGGRFLSPLVPLVAALAGAGLASRLDRRSAAAAGALALVPALAGVAFLVGFRHGRSIEREDVVTLARQADGVVLDIGQQAQVFWSPAIEVPVLGNGPDGQSPGTHALELFARAGIDRVVYLTPLSPGSGDLPGYRIVARQDRTETDALTVLVLERVGGG